MVLGNASRSGFKLNISNLRTSQVICTTAGEMRLVGNQLYNLQTPTLVRNAVGDTEDGTYNLDLREHADCDRMRLRPGLMSRSLLLPTSRSLSHVHK